jgi:hypothetical protein
MVQIIAAVDVFFARTDLDDKNVRIVKQSIIIKTVTDELIVEYARSET